MNLRPPFGSISIFKDAKFFDNRNGWMTEEMFAEWKRYLRDPFSVDFVKIRGDLKAVKAAHFYPFPLEGMRVLTAASDIQILYDGYTVAYTEDEKWILIGQRWWKVTKSELLMLRSRLLNLTLRGFESVTKIAGSVDTIDTKIYLSETALEGNWDLDNQKSEIVLEDKISKSILFAKKKKLFGFTLPSLSRIGQFGIGQTPPPSSGSSVGSHSHPPSRQIPEGELEGTPVAPVDPAALERNRLGRFTPNVPPRVPRPDEVIQHSRPDLFQFVIPQEVLGNVSDGAGGCYAIRSNYRAGSASTIINLTPDEAAVFSRNESQVTASMAAAASYTGPPTFTGPLGPRPMVPPPDQPEPQLRQRPNGQWFAVIPPGGDNEPVSQAIYEAREEQRERAELSRRGGQWSNANRISRVCPTPTVTIIDEDGLGFTRTRTLQGPTGPADAPPPGQAVSPPGLTLSNAPLAAPSNAAEFRQAQMQRARASERRVAGRAAGYAAVSQIGFLALSARQELLNRADEICRAEREGRPPTISEKVATQFPSYTAFAGFITNNTSAENIGRVESLGLNCDEWSQIINQADRKREEDLAARAVGLSGHFLASLSGREYEYRSAETINAQADALIEASRKWRARQCNKEKQACVLHNLAGILSLGDAGRGSEMIQSLSRDCNAIRYLKGEFDNPDRFIPGTENRPERTELPEGAITPFVSQMSERERADFILLLGGQTGLSHPPTTVELMVTAGSSNAAFLTAMNELLNRHREAGNDDEAGAYEAAMDALNGSRWPALERKRRIGNPCDGQPDDLDCTPDPVTPDEPDCGCEPNIICIRRIIPPITVNPCVRAQLANAVPLPGTFGGAIPMYDPIEQGGWLWFHINLPAGNDITELTFTGHWTAHDDDGNLFELVAGIWIDCETPVHTFTGPLNGGTPTTLEYDPPLPPGDYLLQVRLQAEAVNRQATVDVAVTGRVP